MLYDLLIVGAGCAGLYVATRYLKRNPTHKVLLLEKNTRLGGRVYTHRMTVPGKGRYQLEAGAGRIPISHKRIIGLIKEYGLTFQPWRAPPGLKDPFPDLAGAYLPPLLSLPPAVLAHSTLDVLLHEVYGKEVADQFIVLFPYWAEMRTLRADVALDAFLRGPLGPKGQEEEKGVQWGGCAEGLSAIMDNMGEDVRARGGTIRLGVAVEEVQWRKEGVEVKVKGQKEWLSGKKVVFALDLNSLRHVKGLGSKEPVASILRHLTTEPLLRVYSLFPLEKGKPWFHGMAKVVVHTPIRFFIPMREDQGLAMVSYTEGRDARHWMRIRDKSARKKAVMAELRRTFPEKEIPDPLWMEFFYWSEGCTYWISRPKAGGGEAVSRPKAGGGGDYNVEEASASSVQPFPGVPLYLCGEAFAVQQSWMESSLIQAERVLQKM